LRELYNIILLDIGDPKTTFDKKYVVKPVSHTFEELKNTSQIIKLQAKSRRIILDRPRITSAALVLDPIKGDTINSGGVKSPNKKYRHTMVDESRFDRIQSGKQEESQIKAQNSFHSQLLSQNNGILSEISSTSNEDESSINESKKSGDSELADALDDLKVHANEEKNSELAIRDLKYLKKRLFD
jgi:hypothetical protein